MDENMKRINETIRIIEAYTKVMKVAIAYKESDITAQVAMEQIVYLLMDTELERKND
jgi:hypothetical protein